MKKLLTLVLCWLLAFSAMAETTFKVKTALSVAGNYITSMNKVDGSFEDELTSWEATNSTITKTASSGSFRFNGNFHGVWQGTGVATLDLKWTATATNTYEASLWLSNSENDLQVCAVVNSVETGCKQVPSQETPKHIKVSVIADSVIGTGFYLRLKHTGTDAFNIATDEGKIEPWNLQNVQTVEQGGVYHNAKASTMVQSSGDLGFNLSNLTYSESFLELFTVENTSNVTRFIAKKKGQINNAVLTGWSSSADMQLSIKKNTVIVLDGQQTTAVVTNGILSAPINFNTGDVITFYSNKALVSTADIRLSITATAISDNVITSYQDGMAAWSATSTIQIGATTAAPTKGATDLDQVKWIKRGESAELWYQYNQTGAGTAGSGDYLFSLPSGMQFAGHVTKFTNLEGSGDWNTKNTIPAGAVYQSSFVGSAYIIPYDSTRFRLGYIGGTTSNATSMGVLGSAAGALSNENTSFSLKFTAPILGWSSSPTLLALPNGVETDYTIEAAGNAGQDPVTGDIPFISTRQDGFYWDGTGFTAPFDCEISFVGSMATSSAQGGLLYYYINGTQGKAISTAYAASNIRPFTGTVKLTKNQRLSIRSSQTTGTLSTSVVNHWIKITKLNGKIDKTYVGSVAKNQVATLYANNATVASVAGGYVDLTWDGVLGDTSIVGMTAGQANFILQQGEYLIESEGIAYQTSEALHNLYNVTTGSEVEHSSMSYSGDSLDMIVRVGGKFSKLLVSQTTTFKIRQFASTARANGFGFPSRPGFRAKLQITKLNGQ